MSGFDLEELDVTPEEKAAFSGEPKVSQAPSAAFVDDAARQLVANLIAQPVAKPTLESDLKVSEDAFMSDVEKRLEVARCYQQLSQGGLFSTSTEASRLVEFEVMAFVRDRLGIMMGIVAPVPVSKQLTDIEVEVVRMLGELTPVQVGALKSLADKMIVATGGVVPVFVSNKTAPAAPPVVVPRTQPVAPTLVQRAAPTSLGGEVAQIQAPRGPGRPPGAKNKPKDTQEVVEVLNPQTGKMVKSTHQRIQRPSGMMSMPTGAAATAATAVLSGAAADAINNSKEATKLINASAAGR